MLLYGIIRCDYLVKPMDGKVMSISNRKKYVFLIIVCSRNDLQCSTYMYHMWT